MIEDLHNKIELVRYYRTDPVAAAKDLLKIDLSPHQRLALCAMWYCDHTIMVLTRGGGKSFIVAVFSILRALLYPGERVGIFGPSYRQAKFVFAEIERLYDLSPDLRAACAKKPTKMTDLCYLEFLPSESHSGSVIHALPLGDGGKIRGARYFTVIVDEAAQVPKDILDVVVRGMMATTKNPMENVRWLERQKQLLAEGVIDKVQKLHRNKIVLSSTAYYQYNHLWERVNGYQKILLEKRDQMQRLLKEGKPVPEELQVTCRGHDLNNGQIAYNLMQDNERALVAFDWKDLPEGFMSEDVIAEAERESPTYQFRMEFFVFFPPDSDGFFPRSLLDKSQAHRLFSCAMELAESPKYVHIMGIDPARSGDNFAIAIFRVSLLERKVHLVRMLTYNKKSYPFMHLEIRRLRRVYHIHEIFMDSGGGGTTIRDLLADEKSCPAGDDIILQRGFAEHEGKKGKRILTLVEFSRYEWVHDANHNLLLGLQNGMLQLPCEKGALIAASPTGYDETAEEELAYEEIKKTMDEIQNIVTRQTATGRTHWDTPQRRQRKDRYSAVLIGYDGARSYIEGLEQPQELASGFWLK